MTRIIRSSLMLTVALMGTPAAWPAENGPSIELIESVRVAFYEKAPAPVAVSMRLAVQKECAARRTRGPTGAANTKDGTQGAGSDWLCEGRHLNYLRAVDVLGNRRKTGFVCNDDAGMSPPLLPRTSPN